MFKTVSEQFPELQLAYFSYNISEISFGALVPFVGKKKSFLTVKNPLQQSQRLSFKDII